LVKIRVYVEGANRSDVGKRAGAKAFRLFAEEAGISGIEFRMHGPRNATYEAFCLALRNRKSDAVHPLL
jgi:hypothetical protein